MGLVSFVFDGVLAVLMILLIVYCVKLNRGLVAIRSSDTQINDLIGRLIEASDRAQASVQQLKAVGVAQERALRTAIADADAARARLAPTGPGAPAPKGSSLDAIVGMDDDGPAPSPSSSLPARTAEEAPPAPEERDGGRSETEQALLAAIRHARTAG